MTRSQSPSLLPVLPLVILSVVLVEEVAAYEMRRFVQSDAGRALSMMGLNALVFTLAAERMSPALKRLVVTLRRRSRTQAGGIGVWLFFGLAYALLFSAYWQLERHGPRGLLPANLW